MTIVRHWVGKLFLHNTIKKINVKPKMKRIRPADLQKSLKMKIIYV